MAFRAMREFINSLKDYARDYVTLLKLQSIEQLARIGSTIFTTILFIVGGGFFLFFITLSLGFLLAKVLHSEALGFLLVAGLWAVIVVVLYFLRHALFTDNLVRKLIELFFPSIEEDDPSHPTPPRGA